MTSDRLHLEDLIHLCKKLSPEERDELPRCLLIAAPRGGEAMVKVLEDLLLCHGGRSCWAGGASRAFRNPRA